ncbi:MAG: LacI family DNA-binding transcriptional regulator [Ilumatobacteraceae bacterium]
MATLSDVATHAGVGIGTASRVVNGSPQVSPDTRLRVQAAMLAVGYEPTPRRRNEQVRRAGAIGVLVPFFDEPSSVLRVRGIVDQLQPHRLRIVLHQVTSPAQAREAAMELPADSMLDALLVISLPLTDTDAGALAGAPFPVVLLDTRAPEGSGWAAPTVCIDDRAGGALATRHLLDLGHRRIGFIGEPADNPFGFTSSAQREAGFRSELAAAGFAPEAALVRHAPHLRAAARQLATDMLTLAEPPTAIVAASDVQAVGVLEAAAALGVEVPRHLSVIGFDDIELASLMGLTTVRQPLELSGRRAADLVVQAIGATPLSPFTDEMSLELVVRSTTRPPG